MNSDIFTQNGKYLMLALDQRGSFKKMLTGSNGNGQNGDFDPKKAIEVKGEILSSVYKQFSGTLIDFDFGLPAYRVMPEFDKPFLLPMEKSGYVDMGERVTELQKNAQEVKDAGASGAKILVYYNPGSVTGPKQIETAKKALEDARLHGLPFFLEILNYKIEPRVVDSVKDFLEAGVKPDVFKLEYPGNLEECRKLTNLLEDTPWIILTKGADFEEFVPMLENAIKGGAAGFLAGRALWKEYLQLIDIAEKERFISITLPERFSTIANIALEN